MTNRVSQVPGPRGPVCLRQGHPDARVLGIDRCREWRVLSRLRGLDIGPAPLRIDHTRDVTLFEWLPGRMPEATAARQAAALLGRLHSLPPIGVRFSPSAAIRQYLRIADVPAGLRNLSIACADASARLEERAELRLCHNDCVPKNWIQLPDGKLRLIDFEFAGDNDPAFDFATLSLDWAIDLPPEIESRARIYRPVVDVLWTLYCLIVADIDPPSRDEALRQATLRQARLGGLTGGPESGLGRIRRAPHPGPGDRGR